MHTGHSFNYPKLSLDSDIGCIIKMLKYQPPIFLHSVALAAVSIVLNDNGQFHNIDNYQSIMINLDDFKIIKLYYLFFYFVQPLL